MLALAFGWLAYKNLFQPETYPIKFFRGEVTAITPTVLLGPYPSERELKRLKRLGVTRLVSLMDPAMPLETPLIEQERALAAQLKLEFRNVPLSYLPNLESSENVARAAALAKERFPIDGKTYVHCYLGRHRTALFKRLYIENRNRLRSSSRTDLGDGAPRAAGSAHDPDRRGVRTTRANTGRLVAKRPVPESAIASFRPALTTRRPA